MTVDANNDPYSLFTVTPTLHPYHYFFLTEKTTIFSSTFMQLVYHRLWVVQTMITMPMNQQLLEWK